MTKGYLNLQNRNDLLLVEDITADEWMDIQFELQPTIYKLKEGDTLRLVLYTTDFEITIRDNTAYHLTVDLEQSTLSYLVKRHNISDFLYGRFPLEQLKQTYTWYQMQSRYRLMIGLHGSFDKRY